MTVHLMRRNGWLACGAEHGVGSGRGMAMAAYKDGFIPVEVNCGGCLHRGSHETWLFRAWIRLTRRRP
jgi:hypothetical protein